MLSSVEQSLKTAAANAAPVLYGPDGRPLAPSAMYSYKRDAARRTGSMKNWIPKRLYGNHAESMERVAVVERSVDLTNNDPHASGIVDTFATTVIGSGLTPHPALDVDTMGLDKEAVRAIQKQQKAAYWRWYRTADAGGRMNFGQIQFLAKVSTLRYGEYFVLLPMIRDPIRPYSLACQIINPMRVRTPLDKIADPKVRDGIELGAYGEAVAIWVKKTDATGRGAALSDTSANFMRIPMRRGHRYNVLHGFICKEPEQVRGWPFFGPAMKYFRDFNDLINSELVSNVVTAALSYFVELAPGTNPYEAARNFATTTDTRTDSTGASRDVRYEETYPGRIMYGNNGEKMHLLASNRPGTTFEPFTKTVKKSLAMSVNMPYAVLFKDTEGVNFAGFRSAMLDAWRVFSMERTWAGEGFCQPVYTMLQEEAYLRGDVDMPDFYRDMYAVTHAEWRGAPKGDIEPVKAVQADVLAIQANLKTREDAIAERSGRDVRATFDQLEEEEAELRLRGLDESALVDSALDVQGSDKSRTDPENTDGAEPDAVVSMLKTLTARMDEMSRTVDDIRDHAM